MADDIVNQLADLAATLERGHGKSTVNGAAAEIERLRAENISLHALIQSTYLKALGAWQQSCGYRQQP